MSINIPPLNQRREDILPLVLHYLKYYCNKDSCVKVFSDRSLEHLRSYSWPGNVRELRNLVERMVVTSHEDPLQVMELPEDMEGKTAEHTEEARKPTLPAPFLPGSTLKSYMEQCERDLVKFALAQFGTPSAVAKHLKIDLSNVYRKMHKYHLT